MREVEFWTLVTSLRRRLLLKDELPTFEVVDAVGMTPLLFYFQLTSDAFKNVVDWLILLMNPFFPFRR